MISFDATVCSTLDSALEREWLETNGIGGFASSTVACVNTRRYHGLLTAALQPPVARYVLLSKLEETVVIAGERFELSANLYPDAIYPRGFAWLTGFRLDPFPIFTWTIQGVEIEKRIFMVHGENTTVVEYEVRGEAQLELRPLVAFRDFHSTTHANDSISADLFDADGQIWLQPYGDLPSLCFAHNAVSIQRTGEWYRRFQYPRERERGLDFEEDLFQPFVMRFGSAATVIASLVSHNAVEAEQLRADEVQRRRSLGNSVEKRDLAAAADQFIVSRAGNLRSVVAGYHWFSDWGRDTMTSLPGLTLKTQRHEIARDILLAFSGAVDQGMLPNRFPDSGEMPEYNTVDASLWYFEAIRQYVEATGDSAFVKENLHAAMSSIVDWHLRGTRYDIHCDTDGLISAGDRNTQLTWMDAKIGDVVATPRNGKPVEIQALWYNALCVMGMDERAARARESFDRLFWNDAAGCLFDCIDGETRDASIRPNQLLALSLGFPVLTDPVRAQSMLAVIERELLTPYGLRTLAPSDPAYRGQCTGDPHQRDFSYHQGTVWPWLLGPYITACRRNRLPCPNLAALQKHMETAGLGSISEIFDGDAPHAARGCIAQAWSVAELLRVS